MLNPRKLLDWPFVPVEQSYGFRDTILYALGLGLPADPLNPEELRFTYESGLQALPTMPVVLCSPGAWYRKPEAGIDWVKMLHGEQRLSLHRPLPIGGRVRGLTRVRDIIDKGPEKGALLYLERELIEADSGAPLATTGQTLVLRGNGGCGSTTDEVPAVHRVPARSPDLSVESFIEPRAALIYRLSGDYNPLHADPEIAKSAGFRAPIFHGLGTFGMAAYAVLRGACAGNPDRIASISVRFTSPVYPGERLSTAIWVDGPSLSFRTRVVDRDVIAVDNGFVTLRP